MDSNALLEKMVAKDVITFDLFGYPIGISDSIIVMWGIMAILMILAVIFTRNLRTVPTGKQNVAEMIVEFINSFTKSSVGHHWKPFAPYFGTLLIFLAIANIASIFNIIPEFEVAPPTKDINVTGTMALMSIVLVLFSTIRYKGIKGWLKSFVDPLPLMIPFKILDYFTRPLSLCLRLFGNILAAFTIMELIIMVVPVVIPAAFSLYFDLFDGGLQAYIFVFLTSLYIGEAVE